jgi:hypothetical protein
MGTIIVPAVVAIIMILEAMSRAEKYTEVFFKNQDGEYELKDGVDLDELDYDGQPRLRVKKKKFEIVEVMLQKCVLIYECYDMPCHAFTQLLFLCVSVRHCSFATCFSALFSK